MSYKRKVGEVSIMKRSLLLLFTLALLLGMVGVAGAISFTDTQWLFRSYSGVGSDSWLHNTPPDFSTPTDTVNSATLDILAWLVDGNNDFIEINGQAQGTLNSGSSWIFGLSWTGFDIGDSFATWTAGDPLKVTLDYNEQGWSDWNFMIVKGSKFTLNYENGPDPVSAPVPEPSTILMLSTGLVGLAGLARKKLLKK